jgi:hypothetical protein
MTSRKFRAFLTSAFGPVRASRRRGGLTLYYKGGIAIADWCKGKYHCVGF